MTTGATNYLVEIQATSGTVRFGVLAHDDGTNVWEPRIVNDPSIRKAIPDLSAGVQDNDSARIDLRNDDGALDAWMTDADDIRGVVAKVYDVEAGTSDTPVLILGGLIRKPSQLRTREGFATLTITVEPQASSVLGVELPTVTTTVSGFGVAAGSIIREQLNRAVPAMLASTREHFIAPKIKEDPDNDIHDYVVCHDEASDLVRVDVAALYRRAPLQGFAVVPPSEYTVSRSQYAGFLSARFTRAQVSEIFADVSMSEFDTARSGVVRHWRFRRDLRCSQSGASELEVANDLVADYKFNDDLTDDGPSGEDLVKMSGADDPIYVTESGGDKSLENYIDVGGGGGSNLCKAKLSSGDATFADFDGTDDFRVEVRVAREEVSGGKGISGYVFSKINLGRGWAIRFYNSIPIFSVAGQTAGGIVTREVVGPQAIDDGALHDVVGSVDRTTDLMELWVDGALVGSADISDLGTFENQGEAAPGTIVAMGLLNTVSDLRAVGRLARARIYNSAYEKTYTFGRGHDDQAISAVTIQAAAVEFKESSPSGIEAGLSDDQVIIGWLKKSSAPGSQEVVAKKQNTASDGFLLTLETDGTLIAKVGDGTDTATRQSAASLCDDEWHEFCVVLDRSDDTLSLYIDGLLDGSAADASAVGALTNSGDFTIKTLATLDELAILRGSGKALSAAEVRTHYMTASGNPARAVRRIIESTAWGLSSDTVQSVVSADFDAAEDELDFHDGNKGLRLGGAISEVQQARTVLDSILNLFGMVLRNEGDGWSLGFAWQAPNSTTWELGFNDGRLNNVRSMTYTRTPADEIPVGLKCGFQWNFDLETGRKKVGVVTQSAALSHGARPGTETFPARYVRAWQSADRVRHFNKEWKNADKRLRCDVGREFRAVRPGDVAEFTSPADGLAAASFRVQSIDWRGDDIGLTLVEDASTAALTYSAQGTVANVDPSDLTDYRYTDPPPPEDLVLWKNTAVVNGVKAGVAVTVPNDAITQAITTHVEIQWRYDDEAADDDSDPFEWATELVPATPGSEVVWLNLFDKNRPVKVQVRAVSIHDRRSSQALVAASSPVSHDSAEGDIGLDFTTANSATTTNSLSAHDSRILSVESNRVRYARVSYDHSEGATKNFTNGITPANWMAVRVYGEVTEAFNSDGADLVQIGHDGDSSAFVIDLDVSSTGTFSFDVGNRDLGKFNSVSATMKLSYAAGGSPASAGKIVAVVEYLETDAAP